MSDCCGAYKGLVRVFCSAIKRCQVCSPQCELTQPHPDVEMEVDVAIPTSEGNLLANVFRSRSMLAKREKHPVIMCMHPYNNHLLPALGKNAIPIFPGRKAPSQYRLIPQVGKPKFSTQTSWESPDVNFWVKNGYAVVNVNAPGFAGSAGKPGVFTDGQAKAYYEAIEWVAKQDWCTGSIGLNGVSFLAITQYHVASCRAYGGKAPPSLKCISPWEGLSDARQVFMPGGVPEIGFLAFWWATEVQDALTSKNPQDFIDVNSDVPPEWPKMGNTFWDERTADCENISVPMLVCASWSDHGLHTQGSLRAFTESRGKKWLYTHRTGKWDSYYSDEVQALTLKFFDYYVKGMRNNWLDTPPVRLEVRSSRDVVHQVRHEATWPIPTTQYQKLFFQADGTLAAEGAKSTKVFAYSGKKGTISFQYTFAEPTELTGHFLLQLTAEVRDAPDMAVFAAIKKFDRNGIFVPFYGSTGLKEDGVSRGFILASHRQQDSRKSKPYLPKPTYAKIRTLPCEKMHLAIAMEPSSTFFEAGESIKLIISSAEIIPTGPYVKSTCGNAGTHVVYSEGSFLLVPRIVGHA